MGRIFLIRVNNKCKGQVLFVFKFVVVKGGKGSGGLKVGRARSLDFILRETGTAGRF